MARKKREEEVQVEQYGKSLVEEHSEDLAILDKLAKQVDIPDDKPGGGYLTAGPGGTAPTGWGRPASSRG